MKLFCCRLFKCLILQILFYPLIIRVSLSIITLNGCSQNHLIYAFCLEINFISNYEMAHSPRIASTQYFRFFSFLEGKKSYLTLPSPIAPTPPPSMLLTVYIQPTATRGKNSRFFIFLKKRKHRDGKLEANLFFTAY